jgi:lipopolysaccharide/colanic/teichoic acid biosynthesis glycosyltransferase
MRRAEQRGLGLEAAPDSARAVLPAKRALDLAIGVPMAAVLAPLMLLVALAVKLDSPGPALFRQERLGKDRRPFTMLKFRSMYVNSDEGVHRRAVQQFASGRPAAVVDGKPQYKPSDDPRITRVGRFIRTTGLDELPQLINVIRGEMSLVGPRPAIAYELDFYKDWHYKRFAVPPGITGRWQVHRGPTTSLDDMIRQDVAYIESVSPWLDLKILFATVPVVVFRRCAF